MGNCTLYNIDHTTLEETVDHITSAFPYMANVCNLQDYPEGIFPWHWHNEVELFYVEEGQLDYHLPSGHYTFKKGEGAFINSNVLHMACCPPVHPSLQKEHLFKPEFVGGEEGSILMQKYVKPMIQNAGLEFFRLEPGIPEHRELLDILSKTHYIYNQKEEGYELDIRANITLLWKKLYGLTKDIQNVQPSYAFEKIKEMMLYISKHYGEKITLKEIANAGFISIRECNRCFHDALGMTPFAYLTDYRLRKSRNLLMNTTLPVTDIAIACGFNTSSYFGKLFREHFSCSPREYRAIHPSLP